MIISENSQLGLRFRQKDVKISALTLIQKLLLAASNEYKSSAEEYTKKIHAIEEALKSSPDGNVSLIDWELEEKKDFIIPSSSETKANFLVRGDGALDFILEKGDRETSHYFICDSVYRAAELIKIGEKFTSRTLKDIKLGIYTYLLGKNRMVRFECVVGGIRGFYFDDKENIAFKFALEMEDGDYFFPSIYAKEFSQIMQILAFVELGDIEVDVLPAGRNNGLPKTAGKITNTSKNTVFVVDSSWNKITIRTDGFAVRGHFRLQPYGPAMKDRRLQWIDAFEKHGYKRRPKAEIVR